MRYIFATIYAFLFWVSVWINKFEKALLPKSKQHHKVKTTKIAYKEGESYRLGECIVTLAKFGPEGKEEVAAKLAAFEAERIAKEQRLTERAEKIMLMKPEELQELMVQDWIAERKAFNEKKFYENLASHYLEEKND